MLLDNVAFAETHLFQGLTNEGEAGFLMWVFPRWPKLKRRADILISLVHRITTGSRKQELYHLWGREAYSEVHFQSSQAVVDPSSEFLWLAYS